MRIVLAHGVLGFSAIGQIEYFNGVAAHLETLGVAVATAVVNPVGNVAERAAALAEFIVTESRGERVHVFAHSMGGLDARHALSQIAGVAAHVATLVTIGTPHLGSPVADAIESGNPAALQHMPWPMLQINQRALHDLTTAVATAADDAAHDVPGIVYAHVVGDVLHPHARCSAAFRGVQAFFGVHEPNDGVVTVRSARTRRGQLREAIVWPSDHAAEVGWDLDVPQPARVFGVPNPLADTSHLTRYEDLVRRCRSGAWT